MEFNDTLDNFEEAYCGEWDSEEDFARHIIEDCYNLEKMMGSLAKYFDYKAFARELFDWDCTMGAKGNVFRRVWHSHHSVSRAFPKGKTLFAKLSYPTFQFSIINNITI